MSSIVLKVIMNLRFILNFKVCNDCIKTAYKQLQRVKTSVWHVQFLAQLGIQP